MIQTSGDGNLKNSVYGIYGKDIASGVEDIDYTYEDMKVKGVIGRPEIARSNKSYQLFFVNKRYVKDKTLNAAIEQAFKGLVTVGKFPVCILNIEMPPNKVDVNVHPAKLEVRFEEEGKVFKALYHAIKNTLLSGEQMVREPEREKQETIYEFKKSQEEPESEEKTRSGLSGLFKKFRSSSNVEAQSENVIEELFKNKNIQEKNEIQDVTQAQPITNSTNENTQEIKPIETNETEKKTRTIETPSLEQVERMTNLISQQSTQGNNSKEFDEMYAKTFGVQPVKQRVQNAPYSTIDSNETVNLSVFENAETKYIPNYKFIGIAFKTYIIIELDSELYLLDQHAAHERIMYEKVKKNYYENGKKETQLMLVPDVITLSHKEMAIVKENTDMFVKAGFIFEEFGENTIKLTGVPNICLEMNTKQLFLDILDEVDTVALTARQEKEDKFLATIACKAAVKAGMTLSQEEVNSIIEGLLALPNPFTCPHGRPTAIKMSKIELEKKFHRRQ